MELVELHIRELRTSLQRQRYAITGRNRRICGVAVNLPRATRRDKHRTRTD